MGTVTICHGGGKSARRFLFGITILAIALIVSAWPGRFAHGADLSARDTELYRAAFAAAAAGRWDEARSLAAQPRERLPAKVITWLDLTRTTNGADYRTLAAFIDENGTWPNLAELRRQAEAAMPSTLPAAEVRAWFAANPPQSGPGVIRYADALLAGGDRQAAISFIRSRWIGGSFAPVDEQTFVQRYRSFLSVEDHLARLDRLLWDGQESAVRRLLPLVDPGHRALAEARLRLAGLQPGVDAAVSQVPTSLRNDPGLIYERVRWRRRKDMDAAALDLLSQAPAELGRPSAWWTERHILARRAIEKGDYRTAYRLAADHGQIDGLSFAQAEFLAGWLALRFLNKPAEALAHFQALYNNVGSPISLSRGAYWAGRAAEALGLTAEARRWHEVASEHGTTFYGQLSAARLGIDAVPSLPSEPTIAPEMAAAFERKELVRVVRLLDRIGEEARSIGRMDLFIRRLGLDAADGAEFALTTRLALDTGRRDLAVWVAKQGVQQGVTLVEAGYPLLGAGQLTPSPEPALIHAVIRQESTFDEQAISSAGARGLMQLMPSTAQYVADKLGMPHAHGRLTADPLYNVRLGGAYMQELLDRFNGSYVLAIAAYNAGQGRVRGWLTQFGDPRMEGVDVVDWIELIPIYETRNYVQRVLEGLQVYRARVGVASPERGLERDLNR